MADAAKILSRIRSLGGNVMLDGSQLIIVNREKLPPAALDYLREHGREIASFLDHEAQAEERAAIMEFDGGLTRASAEYLTRFLMGSPPDGTSPVEWQWFVNEAAKLIDSGLSRAA